MLSKRLSWSFAPNRLSRLREEMRRGGAPVADLTESNPTRADLAYPEADILRSLSDRASLLYQPTPAGLLSARQAVAGYYARRKLTLSPDRVLLTASTSEAYSFLFKLLCDPGDAVLVPRPSYPLFDYLAALEGVEALPYPLVYDGAWRIAREGLRRALSPRARALLLVNPNNPTGSFLKRDELESLLELCRERRLALIADEVFADYPREEDPERVPSLVEVGDTLTFVLSGLSKIAGLPQLKLAWIVVGGTDSERGEAYEGLEHIADNFLSVGTPAQHAAGALLDLAPTIQSAIRERLAANHKALAARMGGSSPCELLRVEGGWYAVLRLPSVLSSELWALELLSKDAVFVHPGYLFDFPTEAYLVLSLLTPPATFQEGVDRLLRRVEVLLAAAPREES
jgi:alanine-synthesizing transaminase